MMKIEKNCRCGHPRRLHRNDRGQDGRNPCRGEVRQFIFRVPDDLKRRMRDSDIQLTEDQAGVLLGELHQKCKKAPSFAGQLDKLRKRGYRIIPCECTMYHLVDIGGVNLVRPDGKLIHS